MIDAAIGRRQGRCLVVHGLRRHGRRLRLVVLQEQMRERRPRQLVPLLSARVLAISKQHFGLLAPLLLLRLILSAAGLAAVL